MGADPSELAVLEMAEAMVAAGDIAFFEWDLTDGSSRATDTHVTMLGYQVGDWVPDYEGWAEKVHPDDIGAADQRMRALISGDAEVYEAEYRLLDAAGEWRWLAARAFVTARDGEGRPTRITGLMRDAHRAKLREARLREAQRLEALGQIAGGVAHDFNNLLALLRSNLEVLEEEATPAGQALIADLADALRRGEGLTRSLLGYVQQGAPSPKRMELSSRVGGLERVLRTAVGSAGRLVVRPGEGSLPVVASPETFDTALLNLVVNARDALAAGAGGTVAVQLDRALLGSGDAAPLDLAAGAYVRLQVRDDGRGMTPEVLERAAEPLYTTKALGEGTGIGLSLVRRFAQEHGGALVLRSQVGEGTVATLLLPLADPSAGSPAGPVPALGDRTPRVLLVDDERALLRTLERQLRRRGYEVASAENPRRAMAAFREAAFDALLTDIVMPYTLDGVELARRLRAERPGTPVVFMTGYADPERQRAAEALGPVLRKPFDLEELDHALRLALAEPAAPTGS